MRKCCLLLCALLLVSSCVKEKTLPEEPVPEPTVQEVVAVPQSEPEPEPEPEKKQTEEPPPQPIESQTLISVCTLSISCAELLEYPDALAEEKRELVPQNGWILPPTTVEITEGESVFELLARVCREHGILVESSFAPIYNSAYIEGISNLYELDAGPLSGWRYSVNGEFPNYGCSNYRLKPNDVVCWQYLVQ